MVSRISDYQSWIHNSIGNLLNHVVNSLMIPTKILCKIYRNSEQNIWNFNILWIFLSLTILNCSEFQWYSNKKTKAKALQERKIRKRRKSQFKKNSIKMKWASAKDKLKLKNFVIPNNLKINVQNPDETNDQG